MACDCLQCVLPLENRDVPFHGVHVQRACTEPGECSTTTVLCPVHNTDLESSTLHPGKSDTGLGTAGTAAELSSSELQAQERLEEELLAEEPELELALQLAEWR